VIVSKLVSGRISCVVDRVTTVTTPGDTVDVLVTDRGIAVNPKRAELKEQLLEQGGLDIVDMETLYNRALELTGTPEVSGHEDRVVGVSVYRDGTVLDVIKKVCC
jgi:citrate lyase subunit alpha/citrate CoA-transferase